ncbi:MAG: hypothetical protein JO022_08755 [Acidobacteriaceae bacterium]|nr:hypothetical protein [Acidobacteriaceae bacterium]
MAAVHGDGTLAGAARLYAGSSTPAGSGEIGMVYANGFGPTPVGVVSGSLMQGRGSLTGAADHDWRCGGECAVCGVGVAEAISAVYEGAATQGGVLLTVQRYVSFFL